MGGGGLDDRPPACPPACLPAWFFCFSVAVYVVSRFERMIVIVIGVCWFVVCCVCSAVPCVGGNLVTMTTRRTFADDSSLDSDSDPALVGRHGIELGWTWTRRVRKHVRSTFTADTERWVTPRPAPRDGSLHGGHRGESREGIDRSGDR